MKEYILRRLLLMIPTMLGITVVCFALIQFVPGGPVEEAISRMKQAGAEKGRSYSRQISEAEIDNIKAYFGFDKPAYIRYFTWLGNVVRLDLGVSYRYDEPVWDVIADRFPISLFFGLTSFFLSYLICIPLGVRKAVKHGSVFDAASSVVIFSGYVMPGYAFFNDTAPSQSYAHYLHLAPTTVTV